MASRWAGPTSTARARRARSSTSQTRIPGRYCLVARTDPADRLREVATGGEDNNIQTVQIRVNQKNATDFGKQVPIVDEPCAPPPTP